MLFVVVVWLAVLRRMVREGKKASKEKKRTRKEGGCIGVGGGIQRPHSSLARLWSSERFWLLAARLGGGRNPRVEAKSGGRG
jgi:hypothetical protein